MSHFCAINSKPRQRNASVWSLFYRVSVSCMESCKRSYLIKMAKAHLTSHYSYIVSNLDLVKQVISDALGDVPKCKLMFDALRPLLGDSIFSTNGAQRQRQRTTMNSAFGQSNFGVVFPTMWAARHEMLQCHSLLVDEGVELDMRQLDLTQKVFHKALNLFVPIRFMTCEFQLESMLGYVRQPFGWNNIRSNISVKLKLSQGDVL